MMKHATVKNPEGKKKKPEKLPVVYLWDIKDKLPKIDYNNMWQVIKLSNSHTPFQSFIQRMHVFIIKQRVYVPYIFVNVHVLQSLPDIILTSHICLEEK